jgi:hypothetical protein
MIYLVATVEPDYGSRVESTHGYFSTLEGAQKVLDYERSFWYKNGWSKKDVEEHVILEQVEVDTHPLLTETPEDYTDHLLDKHNDALLED